MTKVFLPQRMPRRDFPELNGKEQVVGVQQWKKDGRWITVDYSLSMEVTPAVGTHSTRMHYMEGTESESEDENSTPKCTSSHEGRLLVDEIYSVHINELFTMLFDSSPFFMDLQQMRNITNLKLGSWCDNGDGTKKRILTMTVPLSQAIGPKTTDVVETQVMLPCSEPGLLYAIDTKLENKGVPYADRFYLAVHFCMVKCSDQKTSLEIYVDVKYTQKVWGIVKNFIEKNSWQGLERTYTHLKEELRNAIEENANASHKRKLRHRRKRPSNARRRSEELKVVPTREKEQFHVDFSLLIIVGLLVVLLFINIYLYYKLWSLERFISTDYISTFDIRDKMSETHQSFVNELSKHQILSDGEIDKWIEMILSTIKYLKSAEESLNNAMSSKISESDKMIE